MNNSKSYKEDKLLNQIRAKLSTRKNRLIVEEEIDADYYSASVLIPIVCQPSGYSILFTKRTEFVNSHKGQISFPGGMIEKEDEDPLAAALRETEEELGIKNSDIYILGRLDPIKTITGYLIHPFIGFINDLSDIHMNPAEVEKILFIPIEWLENRDNFHEELYSRKGLEAHPAIFYLDYGGETVWGITASILQQLFCEIKK